MLIVMIMVQEIILFLLSTFIMAGILWLAMKITRVKGKFIALVIIGAVTYLLSLIPGVGDPLSFGVMIMLTYKLTSANLFPDTVLLVVVVFGLNFLFSFLLMGIIYSILGIF